MFLYDGLPQYFEEYFEETCHCVKTLKKNKKKKNRRQNIVTSICSELDSELEMLNKKNKRAAVFFDSCVYFIDKCFDVENSHCSIFSEWNT